MKCFYHSADLDGIASAAIVLLAERGNDIEMIGIDYGDEFPWNSIEKGEKVYMVDFSLPENDMWNLYEMCDLIWIDHHKTAIEAVEGDTACPITGVRQVGKAACELAWEWLWRKIGWGETIPLWARLLGRYDVWDNSDKENWFDKILPFQYGIKLYRHSPKTLAEWACSLFNTGTCLDECFRIIRDGTLILAYQEQEDAKAAKYGALEISVDGLTGIAINSQRRNSAALSSVFDPDKHDFMSCFSMRPDRKWTVSFYTTKDSVDVSEMAKRRGGGGHKKAAGFISEEVPF